MCFRGFDGRNQQKLFAKSRYDFVARNNTELSVLRDELVEVHIRHARRHHPVSITWLIVAVHQVIDDRKQWWKVRNGGGSLGYVPNNILEMTKAVDMTGRGDAIYSHTIQVSPGPAHPSHDQAPLKPSHLYFLSLTLKLMMPKKEFELFKVGRVVGRLLCF